MKFIKIEQNDKPTTVPENFTLYLVKGEEFVFCPIRNKSYKVNDKPEEKVRQWWLYHLRDAYGYKFKQIAVEVPVTVGSTEAKKRADIVVYKDSTKRVPRIFVETKKPNRKDGIDQLKVYMNATGCRLGLWSNGASPYVCLLRIEPNAEQEEAIWRELRNVPASNEDLSAVDHPITRGQLTPANDFLSILRECEDYIKAHEGSNVFEEIFKLIFAKLYDERRNLKNEDSPAFFRVGALEPADVARGRIIRLFEDAKSQWQGVFPLGKRYFCLMKR